MGARTEGTAVAVHRFDIVGALGQSTLLEPRLGVRALLAQEAVGLVGVCRRRHACPVRVPVVESAVWTRRPSAVTEAFGLSAPRWRLAVRRRVRRRKAWLSVKSCLIKKP